MWIKTTERLPDDEMTVLIAMADGEVWTGYMDGDVWRYVSGDPINASAVTHWMDLPPHPEAK
jgi:hypothetical protein